ncbi:hypothetical protein ILUMI_09762 [Ignelater luminosus]|uniref:Peptidase S1 domain-containing protein n=1 Tax=Ignelater luminosus TaxID=2038154 RepID=A0A8K0GE82_IGNLU|nr:hypothetical protein ILUMI_09762 [Ignelater luminosus]
MMQRRQILGNFLFFIRLKIPEVGVYNPGVYTCGGSLITRNAVLTAAHCYFANHTKEQIYRLIETGALVAYGGAMLHYNNSSPNQAGEHQFSPVIGVEKHYKYPNNTKYDIALVFLKKKLYIDYALQTVLLPPSVDFSVQSLICEKAAIVGVGATFPGDSPSLPVRYVNDVFVKRPIYRNIPTVVLNHSQSKLPLHGDSGGPVICYKQNKRRRIVPVQYGVISGARPDAGVEAVLVELIIHFLKNSNYESFTGDIRFYKPPYWRVKKKDNNQFSDNTIQKVSGSFNAKTTLFITFIFEMILIVLTQANQ